MRQPTPIAALFAGCIVCATALAGCGGDDGSTGGGPEPAITYARSGGIAGIDQRLEVSADDEVAISSGGGPAAPVEVDPGLITAARDALAATDLEAAAPGRPSTPVPDDIRFEIAYGDIRVGGSDAALPADSPLRPALEALSKLTEAALAARAGG